MKKNNNKKIAWPALLALLATAGTAQAQAPAQPVAPTASAVTSSPAKKELVQRVLTLQQGAIEGMSRTIVERPVAQLMQRAGTVLQTQIAPERREAIGKTQEPDLRKFVDESVPMLRDRALKLAPSTYGAALEEKFTEDELRQFVTWLESTANRKFQQLGPEMQNNFMQKLGVEADSLLGPKLRALEQRMGATLGVPNAPANAASAARPAASKPKAAK